MTYLKPVYLFWMLFWFTDDHCYAVRFG